MNNKDKPPKEKKPNFQGKTNEELAVMFLNTLEPMEKKTQKHFRILVNKYKAWDVEGVDDIINFTVEKIYLNIMKNGFSDGYFQANFETALENNLLAHISRKKKTVAIDPTWMYGGKESGVQYEYHKKIKSPSTEDEEVDEDLDAFEQLNQEKISFAYKQLSDSGKEMMLMKVDEQRYREITKALGLTIGQVKMRFRKAKRELEEYFNLYPEKMWEKIPNTPGYSVSRTGKIRDDVTGAIIRSKKNGTEYFQVILDDNTYVIHELVYQVFGDEHENKGYIYHIDLDPGNNHIDNLAFDCY